MEFVKIVLIFLLAVQQDLSRAISYLSLGDPKDAQLIVDKIPEHSLNDEEKYQVQLVKAKTYTALGDPLKALEILQQLIQISGLTHYNKMELYNEVSIAFVKLQEPKRAVLFSEMAENELCDFNIERGLTGCQKISLPPDQSVQTPLQNSNEGTPFDQAIQSQTAALQLTQALPFFNSYQSAELALPAQQKIQELKKPFVQWLTPKEKTLDTACLLKPYSKITSAFQEGLNLSLLAEEALKNQKLNFAEVIPLQKAAIEKFKEAKETFLHLPASSSKNESPSSKEAQDFKALKSMLNDEKEWSKQKIPQETDRVIW